MAEVIVAPPRCRSQIHLGDSDVKFVLQCQLEKGHYPATKHMGAGAQTRPERRSSRAFLIMWTNYRDKLPREHFQDGSSVQGQDGQRSGDPS